MKKMKQKIFAARSLRSQTFATALLGLFAATTPLHAGTWTPLANTASHGVQLMILLSDGTVACYDGNDAIGGGNWSRLTPNSSGSYVNGTWPPNASMHYPRRLCSSVLLRDGRILMAGGEYGKRAYFNTAEIYNPLANVWTLTPSPGVNNFADSPSAMLPDGRVLVSPVDHGSIFR